MASRFSADLVVGVIASLIAASMFSMLTALVAPTIRRGLGAQVNSIRSPIEALADGLTRFWSGGVASWKISDAAPFASAPEEFASTRWLEIGKAVFYLTSLIILVIAEVEIGRFRMDAILGLPGLIPDPTSLGLAGSIVLVVSAIVWASFAAEVYDASPYETNFFRFNGEKRLDNDSPPSEASSAKWPKLLAVGGLVVTIALAVVSFYAGLVRADDLRIEQARIEYEQQQRLERLLTDAANGAAVDPNDRALDVEEFQAPARSSWLARLSQVLLAISVTGATAIAGVGLVPSLSFLCYTLYKVMRVLFIPLIAASWLLDMFLRIAGGVFSSTAVVGAVALEATEKVGQAQLRVVTGRRWQPPRAGDGDGLPLDLRRENQGGADHGAGPVRTT